jgi:parallel beta-helix repeat protein
MRTGWNSGKHTLMISVTALQAAMFAGLGGPARAGSLEPAAAPAPTMKTLDQVEPRFPIRAADLPLTITQRGTYYLTESIATAGGGITIQSGLVGVTIDLMGFTLHGGTGNGISATAGANVMNGYVMNWQNHGINLGPGVSTVSDIVAIANGGHGIVIGDTCTVLRCKAYANTLSGITAGNSAMVVNSVAYGNLSHGISTASGSTVIGCATDFNSVIGILTANGSTISSSSASFNTQSGISVGSGSTVSDCTASFNDLDGIVATNGSHIKGCTTSGNANDGIQVGSDCMVLSNSSTGNGAGGADGANIHATGADNRIDGNNVTDADRGIDVDSGGNIIIRNSASGNTINFDIVGGNDVGPFGTAAASTSPWANFAF